MKVYVVQARVPSDPDGSRAIWVYATREQAIAQSKKLEVAGHECDWCPAESTEPTDN